MSPMGEILPPFIKDRTVNADKTCTIIPIEKIREAKALNIISRKMGNKGDITWRDLIDEEDSKGSDKEAKDSKVSF